MPPSLANPRDRRTLSDRFRATPPAIKTGLWLFGSGAVALLVQLIAWLLRLDFNIFSSSGSGALFLIALAGLILMMAADRRPLDDFGLAVPDSWIKHAVFGFLIGAGALASYIAVVFFLGALLPDDQRRASIPLAALAALVAFPLAIAQQAIFSGYLLSIFARAHGRVVGVLAAALLFAILQWIENPLGALSERDRPLFLGKFLVAVLLATLRLSTGNIILGAGLLAGFLYVDRFVGAADLFTRGHGERADLLAPRGDPRRSPVVWGALFLATLAVATRAKPVDAARPSTSKSTLAPSFKKFWPFSTTAGLATLDVWLPQLWRARLIIPPIYWLRLAFILTLSAINTLLTLPERLVAPIFIFRKKIPPPLFILGEHRSGTTHLHNLLSLDPQLATPRAFHVMNPAGMMFSGWLLAPFIAGFSPYRRPMDAVRFSIWSPNEEEYAIANLSGLSPDWAVRLPRLTKHYERFSYPEQWTPRQRRRWSRLYVGFLKRFTLFSGRRRPLLKNPYNTGRAALLGELFPEAQFIHIRRDPVETHRSNLHMAAEAHPLFQLQNPPPGLSYEDNFLAHYRAREESFLRDAETQLQGRLAMVRFEDLERDPLGVVSYIYNALGLTMTPAYADRLSAYLAKLSNYQKNKRPPADDALRQRVLGALAPVVERWAEHDKASS